MRRTAMPRTALAAAMLLAAALLAGRAAAIGVPEALERMRAEPEGERSPWRFFVSANHVSHESQNEGPLVLLWRRDPASAARQPQNRRPGVVDFRDNALALETDLFKPENQVVHYAYGWAVHLKFPYYFGTVSMRDGRPEFLLPRHFTHEPNPHLPVTGEKLREALARDGVVEGAYTTGSLLRVQDIKPLTMALDQIKAGRTQNFGYCDGGARGEASPVLTVWEGPPEHVPHGAARRPDQLAALIGQYEHVPHADGRQCVVGDVHRLTGGAAAGEAFVPHLEFRWFADDAPEAAALAFRRDLRRYFGRVPSAYAPHGDAHRAAEAQFGWPALWGAKTLVFTRPSAEGRRGEYAAALARELARIGKASHRLGHIDFARSEASFRYYDAAGERAAPVLILGQMRDADWMGAGEATPDVSGYVQTHQENGGTLVFRADTGDVLKLGQLRTSLVEAIGGLLTDSEDAEYLLRLRQAAVTAPLPEQTVTPNLQQEKK